MLKVGVENGMKTDGLERLAQQGFVKVRERMGRGALEPRGNDDQFLGRAASGPQAFVEQGRGDVPCPE